MLAGWLKYSPPLTVRPDLGLASASI
jgi:hypothetical protein